MRERLILTPTLRELRRKFERPQKVYEFKLTAPELGRLVRAGIPGSAILAYALIRGATRAAGLQQWVTLRPTARDALPKNWRWWHRATSALHRAGFIECDRKRGRLPRYRLMARRKPLLPGGGYSSKQGAQAGTRSKGVAK